MSNLNNTLSPDSSGIASPVTVNDLFEGTIRGAMPDLTGAPAEGLSAALGGSYRSDWSKTYQEAMQRLERNSNLSPNAESTAKVKLAQAELEALNGADRNARPDLIRSLIQNDRTLQELRERAKEVGSFLKAMHFVSAVSTQSDVVNAVDKIDMKALQLQERCLDKLLSEEKDAKIKSELQKEKDGVLSVLAAPFVERSRLAMLQLKNNQVYQAEKTLEDSLEKAQSIPAEAWTLMPNSQLRENISYELGQLHVQNNIVQLFESNLQKLDVLDHNGAITKRELELAAEKSTDKNLKALTTFLSSNYDTLTSRHWRWFSKDGITHDDIVYYAKKRAKHINDIDAR